MHQPSPPSTADDNRRLRDGPPAWLPWPEGPSGQPRTRTPRVTPSRSTPGAKGTGPIGGLPPTHTALMCVALPGLAISAEQGQLTGAGLEGFYRAGRRLLARCQVRVAGREPLPVQARMAGADCAHFVGTLRASPAAGPDPDVVVERARHADGTERITLRSSARRPLRLALEVALGTDLAELSAIASGSPGPELPANVPDSGLRWTTPTGSSSVTADPPPPTRWPPRGCCAGSSNWPRARR